MANGSEGDNAAPSHGFTHLDEQGRARMVDVTPKPSTHRRAVARCRVEMEPETAAAIASGDVAKGDVLAVARVAGIQGAKRTSDLIPLCHPILIGAANVSLVVGDAWVDVEATVETHGPTGVEMEALSACSAAALTIYDMCKARDRAMTISGLGLWHKSGGRSGEWQRDGEQAHRVVLVRHLRPIPTVRHSKVGELWYRHDENVTAFLADTAVVESPRQVVEIWADIPIEPTFLGLLHRRVANPAYGE